LHITRCGIIRRRTLVFQLEEGVWRIAHLHASNFARRGQRFRELIQSLLLKFKKNLSRRHSDGD
jgi:hypothetical protein